jgi:hypothetical protein
MDFSGGQRAVTENMLAVSNVARGVDGDAGGCTVAKQMRRQALAESQLIPNP